MRSKLVIMLSVLVTLHSSLFAQTYNYDQQEFASKQDEFQRLLVGKWFDYSTSYTAYVLNETNKLVPQRNSKNRFNTPLVNTNEKKDEWVEFRPDFSGTQRLFGRERPIIWRLLPLLAKDLEPSKSEGPSRVVWSMFQMTLSTTMGELVYEVVVVDSNLLLLQYIAAAKDNEVYVMNQILLRDSSEDSHGG